MDIDIFPKLEFVFYDGRQRHLDILEYQEQMKLFREAISRQAPNFVTIQQQLSKKVSLDTYIQDK
jgi:hypothetical protein